MEKKTMRYLSFSTLFIVSFFVLQISARTQTETLTQFYKKTRNSGFASTGKSYFSADYPVVYDDQILSQKGLKEKDRIYSLPGQPTNRHHGFKQYGGYVTVNKTAGRALYYYFVEADSPQKNLPLLLWLNGGPGCSSLGYGAFSELGPFGVLSDGKSVYTNKFAWNHAANVLFLESPAGVGFSYSNTSDDYKNPGDKKTAADNLIFLLNWLERFPEYKKSDFYISGESYAGHYVPQLAHNIITHNKRSKSTIINLKGILIGNAVINGGTDDWGMYDYFASHALISSETINQIRKFCNFSGDQISSQCNAALEKTQQETGEINIYNIYAPLCHNSNLTDKPKKISSKYDPCTDNYVDAFLNRRDVQEAMHANVTKLSYPWASCSNTLFDNWKDWATTVIPLLREFLASGLRVWIYSGDIDGRVPVTSTQYSINVMRLPVTTAWRPWYLDSEVGGYTEVYGTNLTFATVREAGHEVPSYQPARALALLKSFLEWKPLAPKDS